MGTPIYAYENGTVTRMNGNRLGGISLYLAGDSGNLYYYTHLSGYVGGLGAGQRVTVGQHIAFNGDTGNARGIPHLHFEVMPGGGGNVNPYPYARRACG
jgi:murein DD-endopeptidase MepM/ murein hydrolase activator NlpD